MTLILPFLAQLITWAFDSYIFLLIIRSIFVLLNADLSHHYNLMIVRYTEPLINSIKSYMPKQHTVLLATLTLMIGLKMASTVLTQIIQIQSIPSFFGLAIFSIAQLAMQILDLVFWSIVIITLASIGKPDFINSPMGSLIDKFTSPILMIFKRIIPPMGGFEVSQILAVISVKLIQVTLITPIVLIGRSFM